MFWFALLFFLGQTLYLFVVYSVSSGWDGTSKRLKKKKKKSSGQLQDKFQGLLALRSLKAKKKKKIKQSFVYIPGEFFLLWCVESVFTHVLKLLLGLQCKDNIK